jgi:hypothetical protein
MEITKQETEWAKSYKVGDEVITFIRNPKGLDGVVLSVQKKRMVMGERYEITVKSDGDDWEDKIIWHGGEGQKHIELKNKPPKPKEHSFF